MARKEALCTLATVSAISVLVHLFSSQYGSVCAKLVAQICLNNIDPEEIHWNPFVTGAILCPSDIQYGTGPGCNVTPIYLRQEIYRKTCPI